MRVTMFGLKRLRRRRIVQRERIPEPLWQLAFAELGFLARLDHDERRRLHELAVVFLHEKTVQGAAGLTVDERMRVLIAVQACLPILNLGSDYYDGWYTVIVYPDTFMADEEVMDEAGVVHRERLERIGESWEGGPVVLSWADAGRSEGGANVVIHEFAHKLDMLNGTANGMPPLHRGMDVRRWSDVFTQAYEELEAAIDADTPTPVDPYAAEDPAEFFAVVSETFFVAPGRLRTAYPAVYEELATFYRQDPAQHSVGLDEMQG